MLRGLFAEKYGHGASWGLCAIESSFISMWLLVAQQKLSGL